ncbi:MAG: helix-turn-helix transcriptional regulator [Verrucomicrobia bacterium]|nr:helix-turn-helix transcriptional regulator [Leptolyngbya sp. ES-bin-22]
MKEMPSHQEKKVLEKMPEVAEVVEAVFGCKWSLRILGLIRKGVCRPGAIERELTGLTPKVQNYYFRRMVSLGILERVVYPEVPPHVEYRLTSFGLRFMPILDSIEALQDELEADRKAQSVVETQTAV